MYPYIVLRALHHVHGFRYRGRAIVALSVFVNNLYRVRTRSPVIIHVIIVRPVRHTPEVLGFLFSIKFSHSFRAPKFFTAAAAAVVYDRAVKWNVYFIITLFRCLP